jgi:anti-sigma B factor antagonist
MAEHQPHTPAAGAPVVVKLPAEVDVSTAGQICQQLTAAVEAGASAVVADLSATGFCDSAGVRALALAARQAAAAGGEVRLVVTSAAVRRVFEIVELDRVMRVYPSLAEALAAPELPRPRPH